MKFSDLNKKRVSYRASAAILATAAAVGVAGGVGTTATAAEYVPVTSGSALTDKAACEKVLTYAQAYRPAGVTVNMYCISSQQMEAESPGAGAYVQFPAMISVTGYDNPRKPTGAYTMKFRIGQSANYLESAFVHEWAHVESSLWSDHQRDIFMQKNGNISPGWIGYGIVSGDPAAMDRYYKSGTEMYSRTAEKCTYNKTYSQWVADCRLFNDIRANQWAAIQTKTYGQPIHYSTDPIGAGNTNNAPGVLWCWANCRTIAPR